MTSNAKRTRAYTFLILLFDFILYDLLMLKKNAFIIYAICFYANFCFFLRFNYDFCGFFFFAYYNILHCKMGGHWSFIIRIEIIGSLFKWDYENISLLNFVFWQFFVFISQFVFCKRFIVKTDFLKIVNNPTEIHHFPLLSLRYSSQFVFVFANS